MADKVFACCRKLQQHARTLCMVSIAVVSAETAACGSRPSDDQATIGAKRCPLVEASVRLHQLSGA